MSDPSSAEPTRVVGLEARRLGLGAVFDRTRDAVIVGEASSGRVVLWNDAAVALFGYSAEEASGLLIEDLVPEPLRDQHRAGLARYASDGPGELITSGVPVEVPALHRDGHELWVELSLTPVTDESLPLRYVMAIVRNVTERKRLEADLRRTRDELSATLEALDQGVVLVTPHAEVRLYNAAARRLLGYDADELVELYRSGGWESYREDGSVMPNDERPIARALDRGEPTSDALVRWRCKDGSTVLLRLSTRLLREEETMTGVLIVFADATAERAAELARAEHAAELRALNDELAQQVALRESILATVSHDMRSSLSAIVGFVDVLGRHGASLDDDGRDDAMDAIGRQARSLQTLSSDLLAVAAIDRGALELHPSSVDLGPALRRIADDAALASPVGLDVNPATTAWADEFRLAQMVTNLLTNADRYGQPPISIRATGSDGWTTIEVRDHGDGVPHEFVDRLFDRFSAAHRARGRAERGTGLGLAIVRQLAHAHGGDISYTPADPRGARFTLRLPSGPVAADAAHESSQDTRPAPARVLVVEDDPDVLELLRLHFTLAGMDVATAVTGPEAAALARQPELELVVTDINLPGGVDGLDLLGLIRHDPPTADIPIILLTGEAADGADVAEALTAGATDFLRKPFDPVELIARARAAITSSARTRDLSRLSRSLDAASRTDALTGVLNRRGLDAEVDRLASQGDRFHQTVSALMIDIDRFKRVNDTHGHAVGDHTLRAVATLIAAELRDNDIIGRWGGEEFLVLLPRTGADHAAAIAERIRAAVESHVIDTPDASFGITVSIGVATNGPGPLADTITAADRNVYAAKEAGRNRVAGGEA